MAEYYLELKGVSKSFPGVKALDNVSLSVQVYPSLSPALRLWITFPFRSARVLSMH